MAESFDPTDPRQLTPEQRLDELALILATGARRALAAGVVRRCNRGRLRAER